MSGLEVGTGLRTALCGPAHQLAVRMRIIFSLILIMVCGQIWYGTRYSASRQFYYCAAFITPRVLHFSAFHYVILAERCHTKNKALAEPLPRPRIMVYNFMAFFFYKWLSYEMCVWLTTPSNQPRQASQCIYVYMFV